MKYCDHTLCRMNRDIYRDPQYWLGAAFFSGFLFADWSWGIVYLIAFLIVFEIFYYIYCYAYKGFDDWNLMIRIGIIAGAIMGFLIGRHIIGKNDHEKSMREFYDYINYNK